VPSQIFMASPPRQIASIILDARRRVIYAAPSLSLDVASALINASLALGIGQVVVILDVREGIFQLGYGDFEALSLLRERGIHVCHAESLRICTTSPQLRTRPAGRKLDAALDDQRWAFDMAA
jgi:hypothetical protein